MIVSIRKATILLVAFFCLLAGSYSHANAEPQVRVYHTLGDKNKAPLSKPSSNFDCSEPIYTVVELDAYPTGEHHLSIRWIDPSDNTRENSQYPFHVLPSGPTKLWAWLRLSRATGAGMLAWLNPAAGLEEFIGEWRVEVRIDNKLINVGGFEVTC